MRKSCRYRQEFSREYFIAKFGFDPAENRPLKVCKKLANTVRKKVRINIGLHNGRGKPHRCGRGARGLEAEVLQGAGGHRAREAPEPGEAPRGPRAVGVQRARPARRGRPGAAR